MIWKEKKDSYRNQSLPVVEELEEVGELGFPHPGQVDHVVQGRVAEETSQ